MLEIRKFNLRPKFSLTMVINCVPSKIKNKDKYLLLVFLGPLSVINTVANNKVWKTIIIGMISEILMVTFIVVYLCDRDYDNGS